MQKAAKLCSLLCYSAEEAQQMIASNRRRTTMQQQARRRRQHNDNNAAGRSRSSKTTLLPLITYNDDDRYHDKHSGVSAYLKRRRRLVVYVAATATIIILFIISICLLLPSQHPKLLITNHHYENTQQAARRISSSENANLTEFITCIDDVSREPYLSKITPFLPDRRKKSRDPKYSSLSCTPSDPNHCFRGVYDAFIDDLLPLAKQKGVGNPVIHNRIAGIIEELLLNPGTPLQKKDYWRDEMKPTMLTPSIFRHQTYYSGNDKTNELHADYLYDSIFRHQTYHYGNDKTNELHADYLESHNYVVSFGVVVRHFVYLFE